MTACVNNTEKKAKGGVFQSKVLRAAMAGVLAIGLMPAVSGEAFADPFAGMTTTATPESNVYTGGNIGVDVTVDLVNYAFDGENWTRDIVLLDDEGKVVDTENTNAWVGNADANTSQLKAELTAKDAGNYTVQVRDPQTDNNVDSTASFSITQAQLDADNLEVAFDGELGWTGDDLTETANGMISATWDKGEAGVYNLVQGSEEEVAAGTADYYVTWEKDGAAVDEVIGSNDADTDYVATLNFSENFNATAGNTVNVTVKHVAPEGFEADFEGGKLTGAVDNNGEAVSSPFEFGYDRDAHYIVPQELTTVSGQVIDLTEVDESGAAKYVWSYYGTDADGKLDESARITDLGSITNAGTYALRFGPVDQPNVRAVVYFTIEKASLTGTTVEDFYTPAFTWNGENRIAKGALSYIWDGEELAQNTDFSVQYFMVNQSVVGNDPTGDMTQVGDYVARLTGTGNFEGTLDIAITIAPIDLGAANLSIADMNEDDLEAIEDVPVMYTYTKDGVAEEIDLRSHVDLKIASGQLLVGDRGDYTVSVTPKANCTALTGVGEATFAVVGETVIDFRYDGTPFADLGELGFNIDRGQALDTEAIEVRDNAGNVLPDTAWELVVTDAETGAVVNDYATRAGEYIATVTVKHGEEFAMGGKDSFAFSVTAGSLAESDVFVTFDGALITAAPGDLYWNGEDQSSRFGVKVQKDGKSLTEGTDYEWYFTKANSDERVADITAVGAYDLHVDGIAWAGSFTMINDVVVNKLPVEFGATGMKTFPQRSGAAQMGYAYTGSQVTPTFEWIATAPAAADPYYAGLRGALESGDYTVQFFDGDDKAIDAEDVVAAGNYTARITLTAAGDAKFAATTFDVAFAIIDKVAPFEDVTADQWYAERVAEAYAEWYINGYAGTDFFGPDNAIKRGDVACILFNVAVDGGVADLDHWMNASATTSSFDDVAAGDYWTAAINWAASAQVVNGYEGTSLFDPEANITREAFASMLANYAKATKDYVAPTTDISGMPGADGVSGWALENVQWAVENGITKGTSSTTFSPDDTCTRAQIVTFLWRSEQSPAAGSSNPFTDVSADAYYADAVLWAVKEAITTGTTRTTFSPDAECTRAQIVTFLWRCKK